MKIRNRHNIRLRKMGSRYMIVNPSSSAINMTDVYTLSCEIADLASWLMEEYDVAPELATADATATAEEWLRLELAES